MERYILELEMKNSSGFRPTPKTSCSLIFLCFLLFYLLFCLVCSIPLACSSLGSHFLALEGHQPVGLAHVGQSPPFRLSHWLPSSSCVRSLLHPPVQAYPNSSAGTEPLLKVPLVLRMAKNFQIQPNRTKESNSKNRCRKIKDNTLLVINGRNSTKEEAKFNLWP